MHVSDGLTHYEVLGVEKLATSAEIRKAYRQKALKHHPDKDATEHATAYFQKILQAYEVLNSAQSRFLYDRGLYNEVNQMRNAAAWERAAADRDLRDSMRKNSIVEACKAGKTSEAMKLLRGGILPKDLNAVDMMGRTPLMYAAEGRYAQIVSLLVLYQADVNTANSHGWTAIMSVLSSACDSSKDQTECGSSCLISLLQSKANPNVITQAAGDTPLFLACVSGSLRFIQILLDYAADVNIAGDAGMTPLALAADSGHIAVVTCLLNAAASVDVPDCAGRTALMCASALAHKDVVAVLLEAGADPLARSIDGCTSLLNAIEYLGNLNLACGDMPKQKASAKSVVALLIAAQADLAAAANDGKTPLQLAEATGDSSLVAMLLSKHTGSCHHDPDERCVAAGA